MPNGKTRLYLHVFDWPKDGRLLVPLANGAHARARLLAGGKSLRVTAGGGQTSIHVGAQMPDKIATVVALDLDTAPKIAGVF